MSVAVDEGRLTRLGRSPEQECQRLYERHAGDVRRYVRMVLRNRSDADDVVQQTFLKALRALRRGVRPERPRQWLIAIAHNECRMHFRSAARRPLEVELERAVEEVAVEEGSVSLEAVREALGQLAPNQRAALVLRELEGRSYEEIAAALGLTGSAVETLLFRARRALREQLETTGSCDEAHALIASDELDEPERRRLRAHTRTCPPCATLERRRRGRLAAASRRLAGLLPLPSWLPSLVGGAGGAKAVAVVAAAAFATTGALDRSSPRPAAHSAAQPQRGPASVVHRAREVAARPATRVAAPPAAPSRRASRVPPAAVTPVRQQREAAPPPGASPAAPAPSGGASSAGRPVEPTQPQRRPEPAPVRSVVDAVRRATSELVPPVQAPPPSADPTSVPPVQTPDPAPPPAVTLPQPPVPPPDVASAPAPTPTPTPPSLTKA